MEIIALKSTLKIIFVLALTTQKYEIFPVGRDSRKCQSNGVF
ncbi:hypothetical protein CAL7102_01022 [Dulcicalothrix desertica PCC 7102]|nr:hypothetical protein CAL7102_01022 [Dulcicalothrix desertica PCC 7102]